MDKKAIGIRTADIYLRFPEIMEEEANDLAEFLEDENIIYEGATDVVLDLQQRIDKAVEYILDEGITFLNIAGQRTWCGKHSCEDLLKILKGDDTNE